MATLPPEGANAAQAALLAQVGKLRRLADLPVEGKRVLLRVDFDVPLTPAGGVADDSKIAAALPTIRHLVDRNARVIVASHLGRPDGRPNPRWSLEPAAARLAALLERDIILADEAVGDGARKVVADLRDGHVAMLENLRFHAGEEANEDAFARALAAHAEVYVNDAFACAHRAHASTVGVARLVAARGAGLLLLAELEALGRLLGPVNHPFVAVVGGGAVADRIGALDSLIGRVDCFLVGGALAATFLKARGHGVGKSRVEDDRLGAARSFLKRAEERRAEVLLPVDVVAGTGPEAARGETHRADAIPAELVALDVGPETAAGFADRIARARTVFWSGAMGVCERPAFAQGTLAAARAVAACQGLTVVGGGESVAALRQAGGANKVTHLSTGGEAALLVLEGRPLAALAALSQ